MRAPRLKLRQGDTLIEVVFALAILATLLTVITTSAISSWRVSRQAGERTQASAIAQNQAEVLRAYWAGTDWTTFSSTPAFSSDFYMDPSGGGSPDKWLPKTPAPGADGLYKITITKPTNTQINIVGGPPVTTTTLSFKITVTWKSIGLTATNNVDQTVELGKRE